MFQVSTLTFRSWSTPIPQTENGTHNSNASTIPDHHHVLFRMGDSSFPKSRLTQRFYSLV